MFRNIETERQEKLTTLYSDCVEQEWKRFLLASSALALAAVAGYFVAKKL